MLKRAFLSGAMLLLSSGALAGSTVLRLNATGTILPPPQWQSDKDVPIDDIYFDFGGQIANKDPLTNRDSNATKAKLVNALSDPARVDLERPKKCSIGNTNVDDQFVYVMLDAAELPTDQSLNVRRGVLYSLALRFAAAGKYGSASGRVNCQTPGTLTYAY